ncbi:hypothetical protein ACFOOM_24545 [Streptomyces echinoruber]|nr:hypothetical protein [Streptomyces echinoruber]
MRWQHPAAVIDLFSRRLLGHAAGARHDAEFVAASRNAELVAASRNTAAATWGSEAAA